MKSFRMLFLSLLVIQGCTHIKFPEIPEYKLSKTGVFLVSESPELWRFYERSVFEEERSLNFLVKNTDAKERTLDLSKAMIHINSETASLTCKSVVGSALDIVLQTNQMTQISCALHVVPTDKNQLGYKDTLARIEIPVKDEKPIQFERMFRIEEFQ